MALTIALLCGLAAALIAFILTRHGGGTTLMGIGASASTFITVSGFVAWLEEKLDLL
ncbi:hypothetical protein [Streptomyces sp. NPDC090022]|uniref:hypothetical protein n=1 Tax=Streptomyces sp. NPDC090022 TaxID=3365920 RepID=UPI0038158DF2